MTDKHDKPILHGGLAEEIGVRDALEGLHDFACYIGLQAVPWPFELLSDAPSRAQPERYHAPQLRAINGKQRCKA